MRNEKGESLLQFPDNYVVIDIETTGLSPDYDSIIELCALKYSNRNLHSKFTTLINPGFEISDFISSLTGITNEMLSDAPSLENTIRDFEAFIGDSILVGHNVNFDINFIYDAYEKHLSKPLSNDFIDTLRLARRLHKEERHNRLSDLAKRYNLSYDHAHRAEFDCLLTNDVFNILHTECIEQYGSVEDAIRAFSTHSSTVRSGDITTNKTSFDESNPLFGKTVVFTGALEKMNRKGAMQIVADYGGINGDSVTKSTNYLVLGNNDYCTSIKGGKSSKHKKAEKLKLNGQDIEIIPENVFYDMIDLEQYNSLKKSTDTSSSSIEKAMTTDVFTDLEIAAFQYVKQLLINSGRDASLLRCNLQSDNTLCISNFFEIIKLKLRGRKMYFTVWSNFNLSQYDLSSFNTEPSPASASSRSDRFIMKSVDDLSKIDELLLDLADHAFASAKKYEKEVGCGVKNIKAYLKDEYC